MVGLYFSYCLLYWTISMYFSCRLSEQSMSWLGGVWRYSGWVKLEKSVCIHSLYTHWWCIQNLYTVYTVLIVHTHPINCILSVWIWAVYVLTIFYTSGRCRALFSWQSQRLINARVSAAARVSSSKSHLRNFQTAALLICANFVPVNSSNSNVCRERQTGKIWVAKLFHHVDT